MPFVWALISAGAGILTGIVYEKETDESVVKDTATGSTLTWYDKTLMAGAGLLAFYIYKKVK